MRYLQFITSVMIIYAIQTGCKNDPNQVYLDTIAKKVQEDGMGFDLKYESQDFQWIDTVTVKDSLDYWETKEEEEFKEEINALKNLLTSEAEKSNEYWDDQIRYRVRQGFNTDVQDSLKMAFNARLTSDNLQDQLSAAATMNRYYYEYDNTELYKSISDGYLLWLDIRKKIDSLNNLNQDQVIFYIAENRFKINNPAFNGQRQELTNRFYFDSEFNIAGRK